MKYDEILRWREDVFNAVELAQPHPKPATFIYNATWAIHSPVSAEPASTPFATQTKKAVLDEDCALYTSSPFFVKAARLLMSFLYWYTSSSAFTLAAIR